MSLFRGIAFIVLGDQAYKGYPGELCLLRPGLCLVGGLVRAGALPRGGRRSTGFLLHRTSFGRRVFAIGNNPVAAQFSGVRVGRIKFILFCLTGLMSRHRRRC